MGVKNKKMNLKNPQNSEIRGFLMLDSNPFLSANPNPNLLKICRLGFFFDVGCELLFESAVLIEIHLSFWSL